MDKYIEIFKTPRGRFAIDTIADAKMAAVFRCGLHHQEGTIKILSAFITSKSVVVDGGAHIGSIAIPLAKHAKKIFAYEPDTNSLKLLHQNIELNKVTVDARNKGLGARASQGSVVAVNDGSAGAHTLTVGEGTVSIVALDDELKRFDVLKLDVEGMELFALKGSRRIIKQARPVVLFEVNLSQLRSHNTSLRELELFFKTQSYRLYLPFYLRNTLVLGLVQHLSLITLLYYPGAYLFHRTSSVFDILALPKEQDNTLSVVSVWSTIKYVIAKNLHDKISHFRKIV